MTPPLKESHNNWIRFRASLQFYIDDPFGNRLCFVAANSVYTG